jgi:hypothetical protein
MGVGSSDWFLCTVTLMGLLSVHALIDAVCTLATLFPALRWGWFASLYPSLFRHSHVREVHAANPKPT